MTICQLPHHSLTSRSRRRLRFQSLRSGIFHAEASHSVLPENVARQLILRDTIQMTLCRFFPAACRASSVCTMSKFCLKLSKSRRNQIMRRKRIGPKRTKSSPPNNQKSIFIYCLNVCSRCFCRFPLLSGGLLLSAFLSPLTRWIFRV